MTHELPTVHDHPMRWPPDWDRFGSAVNMTNDCPQPGLVAVEEGGALVVTWDGEQGQELHARFSVVDGTPTV